MKYSFVFFFILFSNLTAQDNLIFNNKTNKIVDIIEITDNDVIYKKVNDKKEKIFIQSFSQLKQITFRDCTTINVDSIYQVSQGLTYLRNDAVVPSIEKAEEKFRQPDMEMYKKGVEDANYYYGYGDFILPSRGIFKLHTGETDHYRQNSVYKSTEMDIDYPSPNLAKNQDYRAGYIDELARKRTVYRIGTITGISFIVFSFIFISRTM